MNVPKMIEQDGQRVLTTAQLAEAYGANAIEVSHNFTNNKSRYTEGKHFYCLTGDALRAFKRECENLSIAIPKNVNRFYLWTERGALLHAKSLNTDKAWEVYDFLVEHYFRAVTMDDLMDMTADQMLKDAKAYSKNSNRKQVSELRKYHELQCKADISKAKASIAQIELLDYLNLHPDLMDVVNIPMLEKK